MKIVDQGIVFDATSAPAERRFCAWTNPTVLSDGTWLVSFHSGSAKDAPDENTVIRGSEDEGKTDTCGPTRSNSRSAYWRRSSGTRFLKRRCAPTRENR